VGAISGIAEELRTGIWSWLFRPGIGLTKVVSAVLFKVLSEVRCNALSAALSTAPALWRKLRAEAPRPIPAESMADVATSSLEAHLPVCM
jgi:hypothetical protein